MTSIDTIGTVTTRDDHQGSGTEPHRPGTTPRTTATASRLPLDVAENAFRLLMEGPQPLSVNGAKLCFGLPKREIPLDELRTILLHPLCARTIRDEVWRHLISQSRTHRGAWTVTAVALALPMLRRLVRTMAEQVTVEREDLEAEVLTCYLEALERVNLTWTQPLLRLFRLTRFAVLRAHAVEPPHLLADPDPVGDRSLSYPAGHPDLLLMDAVRQEIITAEAAEVIGMTRLEGVPLSVYCRRRGLLYCAVLKRRQRAEARLAKALIDGELSAASL
ncbi:hypothetical protein [Microtetraspora niveoalba]|uniref:hypothetical protein n=1 Tax=Microtetraspora niveoalba TaxID=46175 RepID=UPI00083413A9|nr:hypothetical protein [Microtetraspora niveoalba]